MNNPNPIVLVPTFGEPRGGYGYDTVYANISLQFGQIVDDACGGRSHRLEGFSSYLDYPMFLAGLYVTCLVDGEARDWEDSYAHRVAYEPGYKVELNHAIAMHKTLKSIDNRYRKFRQGNPNSFGFYVQAIAKCCKVKSIVLDNNEFLEFPEAAKFIDRKVKEVRDECCRRQALMPTAK